jgi:hypothetical protein
MGALARFSSMLHLGLPLIVAAVLERLKSAPPQMNADKR